jgi:hypothetical protein
MLVISLDHQYAGMILFDFAVLIFSEMCSDAVMASLLGKIYPVNISMKPRKRSIPM